MEIFGRRHLEYLLSEFVEYYQKARPHQGLGQRTPSGDIPDQPVTTGRIVARPHQGLGQRTPSGDIPDQPVTTGRIVRRDRLGGLIHEY